MSPVEYFYYLQFLAEMCTELSPHRHKWMTINYLSWLHHVCISPVLMEVTHKTVWLLGSRLWLTHNKAQSFNTTVKNSLGLCCQTVQSIQGTYLKDLWPLGWCWRFHHHGSRMHTFQISWTWLTGHPVVVGHSYILPSPWLWLPPAVLHMLQSRYASLFSLPVALMCSSAQILERLASK